MQKESIQYIEKVWGEEIVFVNNDRYCGKFLALDEGAECSYHCHPKKKETFMCLEGYVTLDIEGKDYALYPFTRAKTIFPGEKHKFKGMTAAVILEVSTHHKDDDVIRYSKSKAKGS